MIVVVFAIIDFLLFYHFYVLVSETIYATWTNHQADERVGMSIYVIN